MPITADQIRHATSEAGAALRLGKVARADLICQSVFAQEVRPAELLFIHGQVAMAIGEYAVARQRFAEVLAMNAPIAGAADLLGDAWRRESGRAPVDRQSRRFHLIRAWGFGFTADVDHVLGHLLLAEITGRTPIVHWGRNSLFRDDGAENAWTEFFEPVSTMGLSDLTGVGRTFYPTKWTAEILAGEDLNKMTGPGSRTAGLTFLNQSADVTVGDFYTGVIELLPWVAPPHPLAVSGALRAPAIESAYRYLVGRYLKPRPEIVAAVDGFANTHFSGRELLAVHVRGSDKAGETANLTDGHQKIFEMVRADLAARPKLSVFLLTDQAAIRQKYLSAFAGRVITTDCARTATRQGVHYQPTASRRQLGIELLRDVYLAARCNQLLGLGCTNVSNLILHLKAWPAGAARLLGPVMHYQRNFMLHA